jgi:hypothetical protein
MIAIGSGEPVSHKGFLADRAHRANKARYKARHISRPTAQVEDAHALHNADVGEEARGCLIAWVHGATPGA